MLGKLRKVVNKCINYSTEIEEGQIWTDGYSRVFVVESDESTVTFWMDGMYAYIIYRKADFKEDFRRENER